ncbi:D-xylose reductase [Acrasis kona]|uniref:D-xylose reductase n=1 Tax=Acrasis kona TaxID=1008807 RepID=A0AAW2ZB95_9EUKA
MSNTPNITLKTTGQKMPIVGFGLWKVNKETCAETVYNAIKAGYRLFDGAADYGNEKQVGEGLARAFKEGLVKREDLFITTKLWNTNHKKENVKKGFDRSIGDLGLDYVDLYLIHFPIAIKYVPESERYPPGFFVDGKSKVEMEKTPISETWAAMEELYDSGRAKNIGVSNFEGQLLTDLLNYCRIEPAVLQIEHHPYYTQEELVQFCEQHNIAVTAYSSFGALSFIECDMKRAKSAPPLMENEHVVEIAKKHDKTPAQVLLRWATQRNIAVVPKSNNKDRLAQNLNCCDFDLSKEELETLSGLNRNLKFNKPTNYGIPVIAAFHDY